MKNIVSIVLICFSPAAFPNIIDLTFDVRLDRVYSYDGKPLQGINIGDKRTLHIQFDNTVVQTWAEQEPWGQGTARLHTRLAGPVIVDSPFAHFVPGNPFTSHFPQVFAAEGITANERQSGPFSSVWYEDLWFNKQYDQIVPPEADGSYAYRYKLNVHWNKTNYNYVPGSLYYFSPESVTGLLDRSLKDGVTFSLSQDAYIQYKDGTATGYDLDGTATLREYRVSAVPEPQSIYLLSLGVLLLLSAKSILPRKRET